MTDDEFIMKYLIIDEESHTGLRWIGHHNKQMCGRCKGMPAGCDNNYGYYQTGVNGKRLKNHRIVFFLHNNRWPVFEIDHIDGDTKNNRPHNLREVSRSQNQHNRLVRGYYWEKNHQKWKACIKVNGKDYNLGYFTKEELARDAYLKAKSKLHPTAPERCFK